MTEETLALSDAPEPIEPEIEPVEAEATIEEVEVVEEELKGQEPSDSSSELEEKPKGDSVQKRIDELTRKRREAERDREYWREQAMKKEPEKPAEAVEEPLKTLADFDYDESAYQQHLFAKASEKAVSEAQKVLKAEQSQQTAQQKIAAFRSKENEFAKSVDDYMDVARSDSLPVTQAMADVVTEMENGPEVLYYLGKNPDLADEIAHLPPLAAARELGRIEARMQAQDKEGKKVSEAPKPTPKIAAAEPAISKSVDDMSQKEFNEYRRKQIAKRGR